MSHGFSANETLNKTETLSSTRMNNNTSRWNFDNQFIKRNITSFLIGHSFKMKIKRSHYKYEVNRLAGDNIN